MEEAKVIEVDDDELWTRRQAAKYFGVSERTVSKWKTLPCRKIGTRVVRYSRKEVLQWSAERQVSVNGKTSKQ